MPCGSDDVAWLLGPQDVARVGVCLGDEAVDGFLEGDQRVERPALQSSAGGLGEDALDGVEPGRRG